MNSEQAIELHGDRTGNCIRVAIALEEAGLEYRVVHVDLAKGEHQRPDYLRLNPQGRVPLIVDHGVQGEPLLLSQSNAILHYLASKQPGRLWPLHDTRDIALAHERFFYFVTDVIAPSHAAFAIRNATGDGSNGGELLTRRSIEALLAADRFVASSAFMAGPDFTLVDIAAITIAHASRSDVDWDRVPNLQRWYAQVMARPGVQCGMGAFDLPTGLW
jgi:GST-like protein